MNIRNKDILNCFPLLASVLGNRYGVEIRMGGDKAMTDGKIIYLPAMPAELDNETLEAARGFVDHESAHIRYSDFGVVRSANLGKKVRESSHLPDSRNFWCRGRDSAGRCWESLKIRPQQSICRAMCPNV